MSHKQSIRCQNLEEPQPVTAAAGRTGALRVNRRVRGSLLTASTATVMGAALLMPAQAQAAAPTPGTPLSDVVKSTMNSTLNAANSAVSPVTTKLWGDDKADKTATDDAGKNEASKDPGSLLTVTTAIGARTVWATKDSAGRAATGQGVTVALLDTGVSKVGGLNAPGKVVTGPDLSFEANSPALYGGDNFGHGTHLAGIIAARDSDVKNEKTGQPKPGKTDQLGVAPDASVLSVKVGTRDGSTDVSQVIAGLDWIVQHRNDNGMKVRVVNLSYGTDSTQSYLLDPLAAAVENAWRKGIVVVVSGGNNGSSATRLTNPAIDPYVIAVGASDPQGSVKGWANPKPASFSSRGSVLRHVDLVAPGRSIASLRVPGSYVDDTNPQGRVTGDTSQRLFRGSGTSQSAAVVAGSVALLLQACPDLTPDQVKAALTLSATPMLSSSVLDVGAGELNVAGALLSAQSISTFSKLGLSGFTTQSYPPATGLGSLEDARGGAHLTDPDTDATLSGEVDVQGQPWNPLDWRSLSVAGRAWDGGNWNGARWTSDDWSGARWSDASWDGVRWSGFRWSGARWSDNAWDSARWSGVRWSGVRWSDSGWL